MGGQEKGPVGVVQIPDAADINKEWSSHGWGNDGCGLEDLTNQNTRDLVEDNNS